MHIRPTLIRTSAVALLVGALTLAGTAGAAFAAPGDAGFLGTAESFSVLAGSEVTNSGAGTFLPGDLGVSPGTALTGFAPSNLGGASYSAGPVALTAQGDVTTAANALMAVPSYDVGAANLGGFTYVAGSYSSATSLDHTGTITLQGDADDVFIFTAVSTLTTAAGADFAFIGPVQACNVFWRVGSSASIGTGAAFVGTVIAQASVTVGTDATVEGRLFAQTAAVTLLNNVFTAPGCVGGGDGTQLGTFVAPVDTVDGTPRPTITTPAATAPGPVLPATGAAETVTAAEGALLAVLLGVAFLSFALRREQRRS
ncbi:MAG: ice-binding family protein [Rhodoglobus sp.]